MFGYNRAQCILNINTLVEMSDYSIKVQIDNREYWLQGIDESGLYIVLQQVLPHGEQQDEGIIYKDTTETLLQQIALTALSQVGIPN